MMYDYDHCSDDQKRIFDSVEYFYLTEEEQVNFHFMMHMRHKLKSPDFMASFENNLLASKFGRFKSECPYFDQIDYTQSFIRMKDYDLSDMDRDTFQRMLNDAHNPPIIAKGLIKDSKAVQTWTHQYLMEHYQDVEIMAMSGNGQSHYRPDYKKLKLRDIIESQLNPKAERSYYINNSAEIFKDHPRLVEEIGADKVLDLLKGHSLNSFSQVFIGNLRTWGTTWHQGNDLSCALMINGVKRWFFMDPRLNYILKPVLDGSNGMGTLTDVRYSLEFHRVQNPLYAYVPKFYYDLEPGDVIFFAKFWPHAVINMSPLQIMANMRMTEVDLETMTKGNAVPTLLPIYDNIINSDPEFIKFKFDIFRNLTKESKDIGDQNYFSAFSSSEKTDFKREGAPHERISD